MYRIGVLIKHLLYSNDAERYVSTPDFPKKMDKGNHIIVYEQNGQMIEGLPIKCSLKLVYLDMTHWDALEEFF